MLAPEKADRATPLRAALAEFELDDQDVIH
jgi:hypothetical protein